jgi:hypothetical protein
LLSNSQQTLSAAHPMTEHCSKCYCVVLQWSQGVHRCKQTTVGCSPTDVASVLQCFKCTAAASNSVQEGMLQPTTCQATLQASAANLSMCPIRRGAMHRQRCDAMMWRDVCCDSK